METLDDYLPLRRSLSRQDFLRRHPYPFLIENVRLLRESEKKTLDFATVQINFNDPAPPPAAGTAGTQKCAVRRIVKQESNAFDGMVNVGRTATNDIALDLQAVSKFHAYFTRDGATGNCYLTDPGSTNGTYVRGLRLNPRERKQLGDGDEIGFGDQATFAFYYPGGFYDLLGRLPGGSVTP